jgi:hypothetical protein
MRTRVGKTGPIQATSACRIATSAKRNAAQGASGTSARSRRSAIVRLCVSRDHALAIGAAPPSVSASRSARGHRATTRISARALALSAIRERGPGSDRIRRPLPGPLSHLFMSCRAARNPQSSSGDCQSSHRPRSNSRHRPHADPHPGYCDDANLRAAHPSTARQSRPDRPHRRLYFRSAIPRAASRHLSAAPACVPRRIHAKSDRGWPDRSYARALRR